DRTPSIRAMVLTSVCLPLRANEDVLPGTRRCGLLASSFRSSSENPSLKYSSFGSPLRLAKGSTATELTGAGGGLVVVVVMCGCFGQNHHVPTVPRASVSARPATARPRLCVRRDSRGTAADVEAGGDGLPCGASSSFVAGATAASATFR